MSIQYHHLLRQNIINKLGTENGFSQQSFIALYNNL